MDPGLQALLVQKKDQMRWTQERLALEIGIAPSMMTRWLKPHSKVVPTTKHCRNIARILEMPLPVILEMAGHPTASDDYLNVDYERADPEWDHLQYGLRQTFGAVPRDRWWPILSAVTSLIDAILARENEDRSDYTDFTAAPPSKTQARNPTGPRLSADYSSLHALHAIAFSSFRTL